MPVMLVGHDRGARISHRLAVDRQDFPHLDIRGTILLDIVPTLKQWQSFTSSSIATGTFHWPLLANSQLAVSMIKSFGGDIWCRLLIQRWSPDAGATLASENSLEVYSSFFKKDSVVEATCDDYRAGAEEDVKWQEHDQKEGRKLEVNCLVVYSEEYLGKRGDMKEIWSEWMGNGVLETRGLENCGHFVAEEKPVEVAEVVMSFWKKHCEV
jgi:pimeloyl-ACP methyl ester carboxylesterase